MSAAAAIALLNQGSSSLGAELCTALQALGANIAYEGQLGALDRAALAASGARVAVINLAPGEDMPDDVVDWLDAEKYEIVINDSETSAKLEGFDLARFARHLAAKILRRPDIILPPRPPGAVAPPTAQQHWAERVPEADIPGAPPPTRLVVPPAAAPAPMPVVEALVSPPLVASVAPDAADSDSLDAQLAQALQSLEASAGQVRAPVEEVPDLDALLASAPLVEEAAPPPVAIKPIEAAPSRQTTPAPASPAPSPASGEMDWSNWSLEPVSEDEPSAPAQAAPAKPKTNDFGIKTVSHADSLAQPVDPDAPLDEYLRAAATAGKFETIPADVFLSPEVDATTAAAPSAIKPPVLSTLELVPFDDEVPEDPKNPDSKKK